MTALPVPDPWACPDAVELLPTYASRAQWLFARKQGIGGSDVAALKGLSNYGTAYSVWLDKTGRGNEKDQTVRMRRGQLFENAIAQEWSEKNGVEVRLGSGLMRSKLYPHALASVDRLSADGGGLEVKYVEGYGMAKKLLEGETPGSWYWQMLEYLLVTGRSHWTLAALVPNQDDLVTRTIDRGEVADELGRLGEFIEEWWSAYIGLDVAPDDGAPNVLIEVKADEVESLLPDITRADARRHDQLDQLIASMKTEQREIKDRLMGQLDGHRYLTVDGRRVAQLIASKGQRKFNAKLAGEKNPKLIEKYTERGEPYSYVRLLGNDKEA